VCKKIEMVLTCFEIMSGMRINYHKSVVVSINMGELNEVNQFVGINI
jgi:hypothetical protein